MQSASGYGGDDTRSSQTVAMLTPRLSRRVNLHIVTGALTTCTLLSSTKTSRAFWQRSLTSCSFSGSHCRSCSIHLSRSLSDMAMQTSQIRNPMPGSMNHRPLAVCYLPAATRAAAQRNPIQQHSNRRAARCHTTYYQPSNCSQTTIGGGRRSSRPCRNM